MSFFSYFKSAAPNHQQQNENSKDPFFKKEGEKTASNENAENQNATPFFSPATVQPKLTIGQPNDKYEQEADAMADQVVGQIHHPASQPTLQTKCDNCEKEEENQLSLKESGASEIQRKHIFESSEDSREEGAIQRKCASCGKEMDEPIQKKSEGNSPAASSNLSSQLNAQKGKGSSLPKSTKKSMESGFGTDFQNVKIHTDDAAVGMNQSLGAQAFTHGSDVYFNQGKYQPESRTGQHLLAHELTHVVQQKKGTQLQLATDPEFRVEGKFGGASSDSDSVYFDFASSSVDADEEIKVDSLAANTTQDYNLVGFSSEEGSNAVNRSLTNRRMRAVDRMMGDKGHIAVRNKQNRFGDGDDKLQYQRLRRVDIINADTVSEEPNCRIDGPDTSCSTSFTDAHPEALNQVVNAYVRMGIALFDPAESARIQNAVATFFGDASHYDTVKENLLKLFIQLLDQPNTAVCHNTCDSTCSPSTYGYMDGNIGPGAVLTLCAVFFEETDANVNAARLIHEALHATPGVETQDLAYYFERGLFQLSSADALRNTDSYVMFIKEINNPGSIIGSGATARDIIDARITGVDLVNLRRVMAYLEKWLIESISELGSLYGTVSEVRKARSWSAHLTSYYKDTMDFVAPLFGLAVPTTVPRESDQVAIAGIVHRMRGMARLLVKKDIEINKDLGPVRFGVGPTEPLLVNDAFLSSGQHAMVYTLVQKIVESHSEISAAHQPKYTSLIELIRDHAGQPAP